EKARPKSQETLLEAQKALQAAQVQIRRERQARIKAEQDLIEAREELAAARLKVDHQPQISRVSFVVRLTVYEHGQVGRTEIEHVESSRRQNFLSLDGERLVGFMKASISPTNIPDLVTPVGLSSKTVKAVSTARPLSHKFNLIVGDVRVFHTRHPDFATLILIHEDPFVVQARFQLQGPESPSLTTQEPSYEMKVYANEVTSGESQLLTRYSAKLVKEALQYLAPAEVPGLRPGFYRLFTLVTLSKHLRAAGYFDGPVVEVI
ncbi:MAG TPA: hypothetical protein VN843_25610, partial [Anaerolineales bacterium]|nr:hypothetical protein [Anaerolineales bacterium]